MRNRLVLVAATGATVLIAGAGLAVAASPTPTASLASAGQVAPTSTSSPISMNPTGLTGTDVGPGSEITTEEAVRIALAHVGGGRVSEIERELEHGRREWKVEVVNGGREHDIRVDATTGAVTRTDVDRDAVRARTRRRDGRLSLRLVPGGVGARRQRSTHATARRRPDRAESRARLANEHAQLRPPTPEADTSPASSGNDRGPHVAL